MCVCVCVCVQACVHVPLCVCVCVVYTNYIVDKTNKENAFVFQHTLLLSVVLFIVIFCGMVTNMQPFDVAV